MKDQNHWKTVDQIAKQALDLPTLKRGPFLDNCQHPASVLTDVRQILDDAAQLGAFLEDPICDFLEPMPEKEQPIPEALGNYRILEKIGEGGMGTVFLAEQFAPIKRKVALKVIRRGLEDSEALARFQAEHQALAYLDHPYVAHIYEPHITTDGLAYFTMEYLAGLPITEYCRANKLNLKGRLELFIKVCQGVQHAHQRGIIHRDLKPSNILVVEQNQQPVPKIIDFGIAKSVSGISHTNLTLYTERGVMMGTPAYMSPEQADVRAADIDTRTDIYALGAMLYELLCGRPPYDPTRLREASLSEIIDIICIEEAHPPSKVCQESTDAAKTMEMGGHQLARCLREDLDWITMKALEKNRARRYQSALDMGLDIRRYLQNQPITASPPSQIYRIQKLFRRHRATFISVLVSLIALLICISIAFVHAREKRQNRNQKKQIRAQVEVYQSAILEMFNHQDHNLLETVNTVAQKVEATYQDPINRAYFRQTLGLMYKAMGLYQEAVPHLNHALDIFEENRGLLDLTRLQTLLHLSEIHSILEDYPLAVSGYREVVLGLVKNKVPTGQQLSAKLGLARTLGEADAFQEAQRLFEEIIDAYEHQPENRHGLALARIEYAYAAKKGRLPIDRAFLLEQALPYINEGNTEQRFRAKRIHAKLLEEDGSGQALSIFKEMHQERQNRFGLRHPQTLLAKFDLAKALYLAGESRSALSHIGEVVRIRTEILGETHPQALLALELQGTIFGDEGNPEEAIRTLQYVLKQRSKHLPPFNRKNRLTRLNLGYFSIRAKRYDQAEQILEKLISLARVQNRIDHPISMMAHLYLIDLNHILKRPATARRYLNQALPLVEDQFRGRPDIIAYFWSAHAENLAILGSQKEAETFLRRQLETHPEGRPHKILRATLDKLAKKRG